MKEHKLLINGNWEEGAEIRDIKSPFSGKTVAKVHFAGKSQVEKAIGDAHTAFTETKKLPATNALRRSKKYPQR